MHIETKRLAFVRVVLKYMYVKISYSQQIRHDIVVYVGWCLFTFQCVQCEMNLITTLLVYENKGSLPSASFLRPPVVLF